MTQWGVKSPDVLQAMGYAQKLLQHWYPLLVKLGIFRE